MTPRMVHQNLSHESRRHGDKMRTVFRLNRAVIHKAQVCLVHERHALQGVVATLALKVVACYSSQLIVDEGNQGLERLLISSSPLNEQFRNGLWRLSRHAPTPIVGSIGVTIVLL